LIVEQVPVVVGPAPVAVEQLPVCPNDNDGVIVNDDGGDNDNAMANDNGGDDN
jgi:hypothetical protein